MLVSSRRVAGSHLTEQPPMTLPKIVSPDEWRAARETLLVKEKELTRARDALAAERRRMPIARVEKDYTFEGANGPVSLPALFDARSQLIVYHFMLAPGWGAGCDGCSMVADNIGHLAHLHARDVSFAMVSRAPLPEIEAYKARMGWDLPWVSSFGSDFNRDFGATHDDEEDHGITVFLRDGDDVFRTWNTGNRGIEALLGTFALLDMTPLGRQEAWEESPEGWPQTPPYEWWRRHDEYETESTIDTAPAE
jgi:predicted dithiol-disulfide oxidoreductase (DUF899 family)